MFFPPTKFFLKLRNGLTIPWEGTAGLGDIGTDGLGDFGTAGPGNI